jgi:hypothetical protein
MHFPPQQFLGHASQSLGAESQVGEGALFPADLEIQGDDLQEFVGKRKKSRCLLSMIHSQSGSSKEGNRHSMETYERGIGE